MPEFPKTSIASFLSRNKEKLQVKEDKKNGSIYKLKNAK